MKKLAKLEKYRSPFAPQCKTCSLSPEIQAEIAEAHKCGYGKRIIARWLNKEKGITISHDAIRNHLFNHVK